MRTASRRTWLSLAAAALAPVFCVIVVGGYWVKLLLLPVLVPIVVLPLMTRRLSERLRPPPTDRR